MKKLSSRSGCQSPKRIASVRNIHDYVDLRVAAALGQPPGCAVNDVSKNAAAAGRADCSRLVRRSSTCAPKLEERRRKRPASENLHGSGQMRDGTQDKL